MSSTPTVASVILELLGRHGVTSAFGIPGVHNLPFWDADAESAPRIIGVRHEQAAGYAADSVFRATGSPGAALLTSGPGAANVLAAFGEAVISGSPVIAIASEVNQSLRSPAGPRGILHEMADQAAMFAAFDVPARAATTRQEAIAATVLALRDARDFRPSPATSAFLRTSSGSPGPPRSRMSRACPPPQQTRTT